MMLVYARGQNHDARLVALLARLMLVRLVKKPVCYIPSLQVEILSLLLNYLHPIVFFTAAVDHLFQRIRKEKFRVFFQAVLVKNRTMMQQNSLSPFTGAERSY